MTDKPISMSVKDYITRVMHLRTNTSIKVIEAVVNHQIDSLNRALQDPSIFTAEVSGFGKFIFNHKRAQKKMDKNLSKEKVFISLLEKSNLTDTQKASYNLKLNNTRKFIEGLKPKLEKCPKLQNISI